MCYEQATVENHAGSRVPFAERSQRFEVKAVYEGSLGPVHS
ncbi:hypothetical protein WME91_35480 [Sorangium sp. So ce269]